MIAVIGHIDYIPSSIMYMMIVDNHATTQLFIVDDPDYNYDPMLAIDIPYTVLPLPIDKQTIKQSTRQQTLPVINNQRHWRYGFNAERPHYKRWGVRPPYAGHRLNRYAFRVRSNDKETHPGAAKLPG
jgi:hypothetical protein